MRPGASGALRRPMVPLAALALIAGAALGSRVIGVGLNQRQAFPHDRHAGLFPACVGCHEGIPSGDSTAFFPTAQLCARCHDGEQQRRVSWSPPSPRASNLLFRHPRHLELRDTTLDCGSCHTAVGAPRMAIRRVVLGRCFSCHQHEAQSHYIDARCTQCHQPLARTAFSAERILALPKPADHDSADFLSRVHGAEARDGTARCATCHARQRCESCHVNAATNPVIAEIPAAPPEMELPVFAAHYFTPVSHRQADWLKAHGSQASTAACATCHAREDCATCHEARTPDVVAALPSRAQTSAPGVMLSRTPPASHAAPTWNTEHGTIAAGAGARSCTTCHTRLFCSDCHQAARVAQTRVGGVPLGVRAGDATRSTGRAGFHPPDFVARHASEAWGRRLECSNCHQVAVFCRDCHQQQGMGTEGRLGGAFHDAQPLWLLRHGQAARQGLESCTSCHKQRDCLQCHSTLGAFKVNPHGRDFDARRAQAKNPVICYACHATDPLKGSSP